MFAVTTPTLMSNFSALSSMLILKYYVLRVDCFVGMVRKL